MIFKTQHSSWGLCNITPAQVKATKGATACCDAGCRHAVWSLCHHCAWIYLLVPYCFQLTCRSHCLWLFHRQTQEILEYVLWETEPSYFRVCNHGRWYGFSFLVPVCASYVLTSLCVWHYKNLLILPVKSFSKILKDSSNHLDKKILYLLHRFF